MTGPRIPYEADWLLLAVCFVAAALLIWVLT